MAQARRFLAPVQRHPHAAVLVVAGLIGLALRLALVIRIPPLFMQGDSQSFLTPGYDLARGAGFDPILKRPPGYPLFIAFALWALGEDLRGLVALQAALGLVTVALACVLGRQLGGLVGAAVAGLSAAVAGQLLIYEHYVLAESVFTLLTIGALAAGVAGVRGSVSWALVAGLLVGVAAQLRPISLVLLPLALLIAVLAALPVRRRAWLVAAFVAGTAIAVLPGLGFSLARQGGSSASATGEVLLWRITRSESGYITRDDVRAAPPNTPRARVLERAVERTLPQEIYNDIRARFQLSPAEADAVLREVAVQAILRQPLRYALSTVRMTGELFLADDQRLGDVSKRDGEARYPNYQSKQRSWFEDRTLHLAPPPSASVQAEFDVAERLTGWSQSWRFMVLAAMLTIAWIGLAATGKVSFDRGAVFVLLGVLGTLVVNAALSGPEARFRYPIDPAIAALAGLGTSALIAVARPGRRLSGG